jgi:hypothetical protein
MAIDYTTLLTSFYQGAPKMNQVVSLLCGELGISADVALSIPAAFDVDSAVGKQLDVVGQWVGASRTLLVPTDNFFAFDIVGRGFDQAVWKGAFQVDQYQITLDDTAFRRYVKAMILACQWDGRYSTLDDQTMNLTVIVSGPALSAQDEAILRYSALAGVKPAGVRLLQYILP